MNTLSAIYQPSTMQLDMRFVQSHQTAPKLVIARRPIRELVAAAVVSASALKVKLLALLTWVRLEAKRILRGIVKGATKFVVTTVAPYSDYLMDFNSDWPAAPYTPASRDVVSAGLSSIAAKAQAKQADKYAVVTAKIMADAKPAKKHFQPSKHAGRERISDRYGDGLRKVAAEAGI